MKKLIKKELKFWFPDFKKVNEGMLENIEKMLLEYVEEKGSVDPKAELENFLDDKFFDVECELESWD